MDLKFIREVYCDGEYYGDAETPTHAIIVINPKDLTWIQKARKALKSLEADDITRFDYTPDLKISEGDLVMNPGQAIDLSGLKDADDFHVDYMNLHVHEERIGWEICEKHSGVTFSIESIYFSEIDENLKVLRAKPTSLPLMLEHLENDSSKALLNERLRTV